MPAFLNAREGGRCPLRGWPPPGGLPSSCWTEPTPRFYYYHPHPKYLRFGRMLFSKSPVYAVSDSLKTPTDLLPLLSTLPGRLILDCRRGSGWRGVPVSGSTQRRGNHRAAVAV